jgi:linoleoyl-CoA desaturase
MSFKPLRFQKSSPADFYATAKERVNQYFVDTNRSMKGDYRMFIKTAFMFALYLVPLGLIVAGVGPLWMFFGLWILMGMGAAGIGLSVMHDANHGAYSDNARVNKFMSVVMNAVGGYDINWRIQHNVLHHTFTNVHGHDEDIEAGAMLRFSPEQELRKRHRYQFIYGWLLYGLMTMFWVTYKDFAQLVRYHKKNLLASQRTNLKKEMIRLTTHKLLYYAFVMALPMIFSPYAWWQIVLGFIIMHWVIGLTLSAIFQPAHVIPENHFPVSDDKGSLEHNWAVHQLMTTANFAPNNKILTWYVGGLNHQIEHHLFPNICHVHYPAISKIVKETAREFKLPYHEEPSFRGALLNHTRMLWKLGRMPQVSHSM